jgi:hypothetical protein
MDAGSVAGVAAVRLSPAAGSDIRAPPIAAALNCTNAAEVHNQVSPMVRNGGAQESGF